MFEKLPDEKIIPITHVAKEGIVKIPKLNFDKRVLTIIDDLKEHYEHLTQHIFDEATLELRAYHMGAEDALIFDLEVANKNFRYIFKMTDDLLNILNKSKFIAIVSPQDQYQHPVFLANVTQCQSAIDQLALIMIQTELSRILTKNNDE